VLFETLYRVGLPIWDTPPPQELRELVEGPAALPAGHALDVGCGSGIDAIYLAQNGWRVTAVDFSAAAITRARRAARGVTGATFLQGDVTKLAQLPIEQPIDMVLDMGCYHSLPDGAKSGYVAQLAAVMAPGTPLVMWEGIRITPGQIPAAFERDFVIESMHRKDFPIKRMLVRHTITAHWYQLRRR
jgi:SAM-dependent methyltransferase